MRSIILVFRYIKDESNNLITTSTNTKKTVKNVEIFQSKSKIKCSKMEINLLEKNSLALMFTKFFS